MKRVYLDNTFSTKIDESIKKKMMECIDMYSNSISMYKDSGDVRSVLRKKYSEISKILNSKENENFFINSEAEFYNIILLGVIEKYKNKGKHILTTKIEKAKLLKIFKKLEKEGFEIEFVRVDSEGNIDLDDLSAKIRKSTILISISYVNEEIGVIQPINEISKIISKFKKDSYSNELPIFYSDFSYAVNYLDIDFKENNVDLAMFFSSNFYGPKDIGVFFKKDEIKIGGILIDDKNSLYNFSNSKSIFLIVGFVEALKNAINSKENNFKKTFELKKYLIESLKNNIANFGIIGKLKNTIPGHINLYIEKIEGEAVVLMLDNYNISVSTGSACSSTNLDGSHVLEAIGTAILKAHGSIRVSLSKNTKRDDVEYFIQKMIEITKRLRSFSAINNK